MNSATFRLRPESHPGAARWALTPELPRGAPRRSTREATPAQGLAARGSQHTRDRAADCIGNRRGNHSNSLTPSISWLSHSVT